MMIMSWTETGPGAGARAGHLPAVLRSAGVRRERPKPGKYREEHRPRRRGARRQPAAGPQVLPHGLLHGRRDHVELPQAHLTQARRGGHSWPRGQLLVVRLAVERVVAHLEPAAPAGKMGGLGVPPPAMADLLVEPPEAFRFLQRHHL